MGTHPKVPTLYKNNREINLRQIISSNPSKFLSDSIISKYNSTTELPFLFKVLSIEKVLSIQAHPDKKLAAQLHKSDPGHYPDDNHKPEMAVAITDFEAFCGFKPLDQISELLNKIPEFNELIGKELVDTFTNGIKVNSIEANKKSLQSIFSKLMNTDETKISNFASKLVKRTYDQPELFGHVLADLIQRLNKQFPNDIGLFCGCLMLNHCNLKSGEAIFLQAKDPHAYISGDIMECMAASDNVIRSGFTPKFKDVDVLVDCLTYETNNVEEQKLKPALFERGSGDAILNLYDPPIDEFSVLQIIFNENKATESFKSIDGPSILIVTEGEGEIKIKGSDSSSLPCSEGFVFFIAPNTEIEMSCTSDKKFISYRAYCEA
ncbi:hypothetical protein BVG19_g4125 [[Candida] boidinii]|nr:hypothetical protein BVG19_g4125 [[Candida] boidinii]OWB52982.1 hypothetical protein B5S27_g4567 [[Candida] boidinii]OWB86478.1 hypothetical protein B5S33_g5176 [[Candida] boidinii]